MSAPYLGYPSEDEYHEHYTLAGILESEADPAERQAIQARLAEIESTPA